MLGTGEIYLRANQNPGGPERPASRGTKGLPIVWFEILQYDQANNSRFGTVAASWIDPFIYLHSCRQRFWGRHHYYSKTDMLADRLEMSAWATPHLGPANDIVETFKPYPGNKAWGIPLLSLLLHKDPLCFSRPCSASPPHPSEQFKPHPIRLQLCP